MLIPVVGEPEVHAYRVAPMRSGQEKSLSGSPVAAKQPSITRGLYWSILSLRLTARVIWLRSAAGLPMPRLTSDQMPSIGFRPEV
ncbi:hypothetical protein ACEZDE_16095 [Streptacidiphilus sp. N8-3]|uniref:Uncharacterized protein n=1 Tax=Streptacidiphilus cavernicola TaxID=3342716 RepID=A0ABV6VWJ7_9ACTN